MKPKIFYELESLQLVTMILPIVGLVLYVLNAIKIQSPQVFFTFIQLIPPIGISLWISYLVHEYTKEDSKDLFLSIERSTFRLVHLRVLLFAFIYCVFSVVAIFITYNMSRMIIPAEAQLQMLILVLIQIGFYTSFTAFMSILLKSNIWGFISSFVYMIAYKGVLKESVGLCIYHYNVETFRDSVLIKIGIEVLVFSILCFAGSTLLLKRR